VPFVRGVTVFLEIGILLAFTLYVHKYMGLPEDL
jgi:hypothetical protein